jgi:cyclase
MLKRLLPAALSVVCANAAWAADPPAPKLEKVTPRLSVISAGYNGLITVFASEKGPVVVDSANAAEAPAVKALIATVDPRPIVAVILTHYHDDHSGGLPVLAAGAALHVQEACLASLKTKEAKLAEAVTAKAGSVVPYAGGARLEFGADTVELVHRKPSHTSGDTVVVFASERVLTVGDLAFIGIPPYIDVADGANTANWADTIEGLAKEYAGYRVVAGHGPLTDTKGWLELARYLRTLRTRVAAAIAAGQSREQAQASVRLDEFASLTEMADFLTKKANIGWVYDELTRKK